jgi:uncharacterized protein YecE (DUF72 family)
VTSDLAVVRMHGHSDKWNSKNIYERFGYEYSEGEIASWAPRIADLASGASTTHVLFNNCYRNYAQVNARQLEEQLGLGLSLIPYRLSLVTAGSGLVAGGAVT